MAGEGVEDRRETQRIRELIAGILIAFSPIFRAIFSTPALSLHYSRPFLFGLHK